MLTSFDSEFWLALQICDSSFPGGTLANSQVPFCSLHCTNNILLMLGYLNTSKGLESAILHNVVKRNDTASLMSYINLILDQV